MSLSGTSDTYKITGTSPASNIVAAIGPVIRGLAKYDELKIVAQLVGATGGTLDVFLQHSPDNGTTWFDYAHFTQLADGAAAVIYNCSSRFGGTAPVAIGTGILPALGANLCVGGVVGNMMRCVGSAGAGTNTGAAVTITVVGRGK